jgi:hypothetical protein
MFHWYSWFPIEVLASLVLAVLYAHSGVSRIPVWLAIACVTVHHAFWYSLFPSYVLALAWIIVALGYMMSVLWVLYLRSLARFRQSKDGPGVVRFT